MQPGLVVHAVGHLQEQHQVLRAQVQLALRAAEVEALVLGRARPRRTCGRGGAARCAPGTVCSENGGSPRCAATTSTSPASGARAAVRRASRPTARQNSPAIARRRAPTATTTVHAPRARRRDLLGVDGDQERCPGSASTRDRSAHGRPRGQQVVRLVDHEPVRAAGAGAQLLRGAAAGSRRSAGRSASGRPSRLTTTFCRGCREHLEHARPRWAACSAVAERDRARRASRSRPRDR